jgi:hypothetical protein
MSFKLEQMFPKNGTKEGRILPSATEIKLGNVRGPIQLPVHPSYESLLNDLGYWAGWLVPFAEGGSKPKAPPAPKSNYSGDGVVDPRLRDEAIAYANGARDVSRMYPIHHVPGYELPDGIGCENVDGVYINMGMKKGKQLAVLGHETLAKYVSKMARISHAELDARNIIRPFEEPMAQAWDRGESNVVERFAARAMEALRN